MNFPSAEFDGAIAAVFQGTGTDADVVDLHAALRAGEGARDDYLWQVELHAYLISKGLRPTTPSVLRIRDEPQIPARRRLGLGGWVVAAVLIAFLGGLYWPWRNVPVLDKNIAASGRVVTSQSGNDGEQVKKNPDEGSAEGLESSGDGNDGESAGIAAAGIIRPTVCFSVALDAPIIVGIGGPKPIELGADVPYESGGATLHVWDWSKSQRSRVMKDVRLWPDDHICLSPDGKWLVWAKGNVLNLTNGEQSTIDLGGEFHLGHQGGTIQRIEHLQFTPDGRRLALLLSNLVLMKSSHPLRREDLTTSQSFQIVEFPAGTLVCEFPAGTPADLPLAFSADGERAVSQNSAGRPGSQIVERITRTGDVRREYEPRLREFAGAIGLSADGRLLAAYDGAGDALIWDIVAGKLQHKVPLPNSSSSGHLRFSPDGKLLAVSLFPGLTPKLMVIDVPSGAIVATTAQESSGDIHWTADGKSFDVIYDHRGILEVRDKSGRNVMYNMYPKVRTWKVDEFRKTNLNIAN